MTVAAAERRDTPLMKHDIWHWIGLAILVYGLLGVLLEFAATLIGEAWGKHRR